MPSGVASAIIDQSVARAVTQDVQQAGAMLQDMLAEVVNGSDVAKALAGLFEEETPILAELRHGSKLSQAAVPLPAAESANGDQTSTAGNQEAAMAHDSNNGNHSEAISAQESMGSCSLEEENGDNKDGDTTDTVLQQPDFQAFAEFVLDSVCFSLLQESAAGKWQPPSAKLNAR